MCRVVYTLCYHVLLVKDMNSWIIRILVDKKVDKNCLTSQFLAGIFIIRDKLVCKNKSNSWRTPSQKTGQMIQILVDKNTLAMKNDTMPFFLYSIKLAKKKQLAKSFLPRHSKTFFSVQTINTKKTIKHTHVYPEETKNLTKNKKRFVQGNMLLPNAHLYSYIFGRNYIHSLFFFWYILLWIQACLELVFLFFSKRSLPYRVFLFFLLRNQ